MFGLPESGLAETLRGAETSIPGFDKLEITTCLRRGEIEMVTRYEPDAADTYAKLTRLLREKHGHQLYSEDGSQVDDLVARLLAGRRIATAESCTAGLLAARLTDRPGSSEYVMGSVVSYSNDAKIELLGVGPALIEANGAVSEPVAEAMAAGALQRFGADTAVAITGIAGPGGGTRRKAGRDGLLHRDALRRPESHPNHAAARATDPTSVSARRRWRCTCCAAR